MFVVGRVFEENKISLNQIKNYLYYPYPTSHVIGPVTAMLKSIVNPNSK